MFFSIDRGFWKTTNSWKNFESSEQNNAAVWNIRPALLHAAQNKTQKMNLSSGLPANKVNNAILAAIRVLNFVLSSRDTDGLDRLPSGQIVFLQWNRNETEKPNEWIKFKRE